MKIKKLALALAYTLLVSINTTSAYEVETKSEKRHRQEYKHAFNKKEAYSDLKVEYSFLYNPQNIMCTVVAAVVVVFIGIFFSPTVNNEEIPLDKLGFQSGKKGDSISTTVGSQVKTPAMHCPVSVQISTKVETSVEKPPKTSSDNEVEYNFTETEKTQTANPLPNIKRESKKKKKSARGGSIPEVDVNKKSTANCKSKDDPNVNKLTLNLGKKNPNIDKVSKITQPIIKKMVPEITENTSTNGEEKSIIQAKPNTPTPAINKEVDNNQSSPLSIRQGKETKKVRKCAQLPKITLCKALVLVVGIGLMLSISEIIKMISKTESELTETDKSDIQPTDQQVQNTLTSETLTDTIEEEQSSKLELHPLDAPTDKESQHPDPTRDEISHSKKAHSPYLQDCNGYFEQCCYRELLQHREYSGKGNCQQASFYDCKEEFRYLVDLDLEGQESPEKENEHLCQCKYIYRSYSGKNSARKILGIKIRNRKRIKKQAQEKEIGGKADYPHNQDCNISPQQCCYSKSLMGEYSQQAEQSPDEKQYSYYHYFYSEIEKIQIETQKKIQSRLKRKNEKKIHDKLLEFRNGNKRAMEEYRSYGEIHSMRLALLYTIGCNAGVMYSNKQAFNSVSVGELYKDLFNKTHSSQSTRHEYLTELKSIIKGKVKDLTRFASLVKEVDLYDEYVNYYKDYIKLFHTNDYLGHSADTQFNRENIGQLGLHKSLLYDIEIEIMGMDTENLRGNIFDSEFPSEIEILVKSIVKLEFQIETEDTLSSEAKLFKKKKLGRLKLEIGKITNLFYDNEKIKNEKKSLAIDRKWNKTTIDE